MLVSFMAAALGAPALAPALPRPTQVKTAARTAAPLPTLFSTDDYPADAIRKEEQGTVSAALTIDRDGHVSRCDVTQHATPSLDSRTCQVIMERARYTPARDARNRPTEGTDTVRIRWVLPTAGPSYRLVPDSIDVTVTLTKGGQPVSCEGRVMFRGAEVTQAEAGLCQTVRALPPSLGSELAAMSKNPTPRVRVSGRWIRDSAASVPTLGAAPGEKLLSSKTMTLQFDAAGKPIGCTTDAMEGNVGDQLLGGCNAATQIDPAAVPKDGKIRMLSAVYLIGE